MNPAAKPFFVCRNSDLQREVWARWVPAMEYYEILYARTTPLPDRE